MPMDFDLNDTQQMIVDSAQRFVTATTGVEAWRERRALADGCDPALWEQMAELGWLALAVPEDAGGLGMGMEEVALLMIELGKGIVTEPLVSTGILAAHVLDKSLSEDERVDWLARIAAGAVRIAFAHVDPDAPGGLVPLMAERDGAGFVIKGRTLMTYDAPSASHLIVAAELDGAPALLLLPVDTAGIALNNYPLIDGTRAADITFAAVPAPAEALLVAGAGAKELADEALDRARLALVAQAVGSIEASVRMTASYAAERQQFGQPIGKFQAIQHLAADMFVASYQARSALYAALRDIDGAPDQRTRAVSVAKVISGMSGQTVSRNGIQIHGGYGVTDEYAISHHYRRLMVIEKQYGGLDFHGAQLAAFEAAAPA